MHKSEIAKETLFKIRIDINETLFYMPGETVKGTIKFSPEIKFNTKEKILHFKIKLIQYEFWDYSNFKITELKNIYKKDIKEKLIDYELKKDEVLNEDEKAKIGDFSVIIIEKQKEEKMITIPFEFKLEEDDQKLLPTFQYETNKYILGIRHLLTVENVEYGSINHIGLFIGKNKNENLLKEKEIKSYYYGLGKLDAKVVIPKETYYFGEEMSFKIESSSNLLFKKVTKIEPDIFRKIEWVGYMKNSLLNKKSLPTQNFTYNEDKHCLLSKLLLPFEFSKEINYFENFGFGGIVGLLGIMAFIDKLSAKYHKIKEILRLDAEKNEFTEKEKVITKFNESIIQDKQELNRMSEEIKKYVYFEGNKVVGFVKFIKDITPPVKGYYFNCEYNFKINIHISGIIFDQEKQMKSDIEFYDGEEYVKKMKKLFSVN